VPNWPNWPKKHKVAYRRQTNNILLRHVGFIWLVLACYKHTILKKKIKISKTNMFLGFWPIWSIWSIWHKKAKKSKSILLNFGSDIFFLKSERPINSFLYSVIFFIEIEILDFS